MSKLIVLLGMKARVKRLQFLGYYHLKHRNYEVWDLSSLCGDYRNNIDYPDEVASTTALIKVRSFGELERRFRDHRSLSPYYLLTRVHDDATRDRLFQLIGRHDGHLVYKHERIHPHQASKSVIDQVRARLGYVRRLVSDTVRGVRDVYPSDVFIPTRPHIRYVRHADFRTSIHPIHTVDYDKYLDVRSVTANEFGSEPYAVFLDQNLPHHAELRNRYGDDWVSVEDYYDAVRAFFRRFLEAAPFDVSTVKVAAHPNTDLDVARRYWKDVEVFQGQTPALVHNSRCVLAHFSLSVFFAAMADVPICFFTTPSLSTTDIYDRIQEMADVFNRQVNDLDTPEVDAGRDPAAYQSIYRRYIKAPGTPDVNSCVYMYETLTDDDASVPADVALHRS